MKVKTFTGLLNYSCFAESIDDKINSWIEKENIKIIDSITSCNIGERHGVLVLYEKI
jgi:hypothetical protein